MNNCIRSSDYDLYNDILYLQFTDDLTSASYGDEKTNGIVIMRDIANDTPTGMLIYYPKRKYELRTKELRSLGYEFDLHGYLS